MLRESACLVRFTEYVDQAESSLEPEVENANIDERVYGEPSRKLGEFIAVVCHKGPKQRPDRDREEQANLE